MADNITILNALRKDSAGSDRVFNDLVAQSAYGAADKAAYLSHIHAPVPYVAGAPAGTPAVPQLTGEQLRAIDLYRNSFEKDASVGRGIKAAMVASLIGLAAIVGTSKIDDIKGTESHVQQDWALQEQHAERYRLTHHGRDPPWYNTHNLESISDEDNTLTEREMFDQKYADARADGKNAAGYLGALLAFGIGAMGLYGIIRKMGN